jgi:hypothetical protein
MILHISEVPISRGLYPSIPRAAVHIQCAIALARKVGVSDAKILEATKQNLEMLAERSLTAAAVVDAW